MASVLSLINGKPRTIQIGGASGIYDETYTVGSGGLPVNSIITLPNAGEYESADLKVFLHGQFWEDGVDFNYVGSGTRTQIEILEALNEGDTLRFRVEGSAGSIYDETIVIGAGGLAASSLVTLPNSKTYNDVDLKVFLNGQFLEVVEDFTYVGSIPRTQIQTVFDLEEGERLRLRIEG
jgi:hypothetical protein